MPNQFTRKIGPLPVWAWGILGGIAVYFLYTRYKNSSANAAVNSPLTTAYDPSQVDPTTGLTYGQELAGSYPTAGGLQGAADAGGSSGTGFSLSDALGLQSQAYSQALADYSALAGQFGFSPPNPSDNTVAAAASPPLQNTSPPPTTPSSHHKQPTTHVANPGNHQHHVPTKKSTAKPQPAKHPASGGGHHNVQSGAHQRVPEGHKPAPKPASGRPPQVHRGGAAQRPPSLSLAGRALTTPGRQPPRPAPKPPPPRPKSPPRPKPAPRRRG
jgi:hypothetical protein